MISLMAMNRSDDPKEKSTLILAPVALLEQWREEIESKTAHTMRVHVYHGNSKIRNVKVNWLVKSVSSRTLKQNAGARKV